MKSKTKARYTGARPSGYRVQAGCWNCAEALRIIHRDLPTGLYCDLARGIPADRAELEVWCQRRSVEPAGKCRFWEKKK